MVEPTDITGVILREFREEMRKTRDQMQQGFAQVNARMDNLEARMDGLESGLHGVQIILVNAVGTFDKRITALEDKVAG
jgi:uncharacterized coiled-coil protein SlyX